MQKVKIFEFVQYAGRSQELGPGRYQPSAITLDLRSVSSIQIPPGWKVTLWEHPDFTGASLMLSGSSPTLSDWWNDRMAAISVSCPPALAPTEVVPSVGLVHYQGGDVPLDLGPLTLDFSDSTTGFTGFTYEG